MLTKEAYLCYFCKADYKLTLARYRYWADDGKEYACCKKCSNAVKESGLSLLKIDYDLDI